MRTLILVFFCGLLPTAMWGQTGIKGRVSSGGSALLDASVVVDNTTIRTLTDEAGFYELEALQPGSYTVIVEYVGYKTVKKRVIVVANNLVTVNFDLPLDSDLSEIVVSATLKPVLKSESVVPVEIYTPKFLQKNPTSSLFDAVRLINGVQPQLNCNVCNTGDIHINGMEGPYTMILIDGMPIVSSLSSVYGLSGIPNSLIERIEVVKGPASSLYGTEAMGGIINVITKNAKSAPLLSVDGFSTSWLETNLDAAMKFKLGEKNHSLLGVNYFKYGEPKDHNKDGFTDVTLQDRVSIFNKWHFDRADERTASIALRYLYEDRWGGENHWNRERDRGSDQVYGESIFTNRLEAIGMYQLPTTPNIYTQFSYNWHQQNSFYGTESYQAKQQVIFGQAYWDKELTHHSLLVGASYKYTYYDDNTRGTGIYDEEGLMENDPMKRPNLGVFVQDEWTINKQHKLLLGYRFDYDKVHKGIHSPRVGYKFTPAPHHVLRASFGTGFRVVNVFTEDHRALTGAREVVFAEALDPEKSYNGNLNYSWKVPASFGVINFDASAFYSYFTNKIDADTDTDQTRIIYDNLDGYAVSQGLSLNVDVVFDFPLKLMIGATYMEVYRQENDEKNPLYHSPKWSGNLLATYDFGGGFSTDLTGNWTGPMRLPRVEDDYRPEYSPWVVLANIQVTKKFNERLEIYGGIKNLFNTLPKEDTIARWWDPYGKPGNGVTPPAGRNDVIFEPNDYSYTPLQGIQGFLGLRYTVF